ncbi:hypothetical protein [Streptomyces sp. NBC_01264]|nr:hypothetical protein [Streptomyces sp. NBC_01264]MCX4784522.1 hypothetical protein [Streptomyces sp. NBC_01264]
MISEHPDQPSVGTLCLDSPQQADHLAGQVRGVTVDRRLAL